MFNKNKNKIDSRIRFQNSRFTRKLESARTYKRTTRILPKNSREIFLAKIGLSSLLAKIATGLGLAALIYLVYIPNFLFIKHIEVNGGDQETKNTVVNISNSYLGKKLPWPQQNILLLSKDKLKKYVAENDQKILTIDKITKHFPNSLIINITPRVDNFLIQAPSSTDFTISNDGIITSEFIANASTTLPSLPILIKLDSGDGLIVGQQAISKNKIAFINDTNIKLPAIIKSPLDYYKFSNLQSNDLTVYSKLGFKVLLDTNSDFTETLNRLRLLFSQFSDVELKKLYYVDMRFEGKSYVCEKANACVKDINLSPQTNATSTPN
jgi:cell division septal protein FtsQ